MARKMENSFFEFRNETGSSSDSDNDVIDNSNSEGDSLNVHKQLKTPLKGMKTVIIESEEDADDSRDTSPDITKNNTPRSKSSSQKKNAEWEKSELLNTSSDSSNIGSVKKRILKKLVFSDSHDSNSDSNSTENSFQGYKSASIKSSSERKVLKKGVKVLAESTDEDDSGSETRKNNVLKKLSNSSENKTQEIQTKTDKSVSQKVSNNGVKVLAESSDDDDISSERTKNHKAKNNLNRSSEKSFHEISGKSIKGVKVLIESSDEEEIPDDELALPPMTRMSMTGKIPKDMPSDESFILDSDDESGDSSVDYSDFDNQNSSNKSETKAKGKLTVKGGNMNRGKDKMLLKQEVVCLSSEDEGDKIKMPLKVLSPQKIPSSSEGTTIKKYMVPESYPNSRITYVSPAVRQNEINKLEALREDLQKIKYIIENMDLESLPDHGVKIVARMSEIEAQVKKQAEKVAQMVVEPDAPSTKDIKRDGFDDNEQKHPVNGPTWDEIKQISEQVQPKMFGKQAMNTHMAERGAIMERLRDLHEALSSRPNEQTQAPTPSALKTQLMQHQAHALAWLTWRESQQPHGGILADDMGLGKTLTMIALVAATKEQRDETMGTDEGWSGKGRSKSVKGGTLVVCPASLVRQWASEVETHCRSRSVTVATHHGPSRATQPRDIARFDLVITSYNIVSRDHAKEGVLMKINWDRVILDEAHVIRNHKTAAAKAVCELQTHKRWTLTGTPVQNKDLDLFALLKFLRCSPFDELVLWKKWIDNKTAGGQERLSSVMRAIMLRRTKTGLSAQGDLPSLPEKNFFTELVTLSKEEMNVYQKVLVLSKTLFGQFLHQRAERQMMQVNGNEAYDKMHRKMVALHGVKPIKSHEILVLLLRLRQLCCHPGLVTGMFDGEETDSVDSAAVDLMAELSKMTLEDDDDANKENQIENEPEEGSSITEAIKTLLPSNNPVFNLDNKSSKIKAVMECLEEKILPNKGEKAVVVSQWTTVLSLVERQLKMKRLDCIKLTGSVPVAQRSNIVATFNDPNSKVRVLLLSLAAGGVGLNLCGGNHLLLLDPHWNPQLEAQAQDRIYRVGQTKDVHIYRFMTVETVEQNIRKLQEVKLELAETVLTGAKNTGATKLSIDDLKLLFNM